METVNSSWAFVEMAAGEEGERKIWILGFCDFYHWGPYGSVIFLLGRNVLIFYVKVQNNFGLNES